MPNDIFLISSDHRYVISDRVIKPMVESMGAQYMDLFTGDFPYCAVYLFSPENALFPSVLKSKCFDSVNVMLRVPRYSVQSSFLIANIDVATIQTLLSEKSDLSDMLFMDERGRAIIASDILPESLYGALFEKLNARSTGSGTFLLTPPLQHLLFQKRNHRLVLYQCHRSGRAFA